MERSIILLACGFSLITAQYSPYQMWSMGGQMMNSGWRPTYPWMMNPGLPGLSGLSGVWRSSHPMFRMGMGSGVNAVGEKNSPVTVPQGIVNVPKVPNTDEILTHMALATQNPKPLVDTISDFLYNPEPQKSRMMVMTPVYVNGPMRSNANMIDDCGPQDAARWNREVSEWVY